MSPRAHLAIDAAIDADARRTWDPRRDLPSLSTIKGAAGNYHDRYRRSRATLLDRAGVVIRRDFYERQRGVRCWIVTMPDEPVSAAAAVVRTSDGRRELREREETR